MSQTLRALEQTIETLSFTEKLWLLERLVRLLRVQESVAKDDTWVDALAEMAADPDIQAEITQINDEFAISEADGLSYP
ncbi:hypothetical protein IQ254_11865 [Nodosilinea sp. LEGE 07088]|uniref:hypothetical protein n=1 Tax=Nodosilinea sp. LEGE 07088 TaxID=2777968 RepID=UPI0018824CE2|nr:hypothetical protein [Nodosilinea sp. LEGE 07088]MBE9137880.1 hypothetical protein [Nodosilinea sp. LEGE 07088]